MSTESGGWKPPWQNNKAINPNYLENTFNNDEVFLTIEDEENSTIIRDTFPPKIFEELPKIIPQIKSVHRLKAGIYSIKVEKKEREDILKIKTIKNAPVKITQSKRNISKGTIYCDYIKDYPDDEQLTKDLQKYNDNIISAKIKTIYKDNQVNKTNIAIIDYDMPTIPPQFKTKLFYQSLPVRVYYPEPQQCKVCFAFGHISTKNHQCSNPKICGHCGQNSHVELDSAGKPLKCENQPKCINCDNSHPAWRRQCPRYIKEKEIIKCHIDCKIPMKAAKEAVSKRKDPQPKPPTIQPSIDSEKILCEKIDNLTQQLTTQIKILCDLIVDNVIKPNVPSLPRKRLSEKSSPPKLHQYSPARPSAQGVKTVHPWYDQVEDMDHTPLSSLPIPDKLPPINLPNDPNVAKSGYVSDGAFYTSSRTNDSLS